MKTRAFSAALLAFMLVACSTIKQPSSPAETPVPEVLPTSTDLVITPTLEAAVAPSPAPATEPASSQPMGQTVLRFEFPFEPAPPGYLVDVKSEVFTANLMCAVENGEILNLGESASDSQSLGICDTSSMTLYMMIPDQITVTVILGGFSVVDEVTKAPDQASMQQVKYQFESSLK